MGIPPDLVKWKALSTKGYKYKDRGGISAGVRSASLKGGDEGKAKIALKASGEHLPDVPLGSLPMPVVAQLAGAPSKPCCGATYDASSVAANDTTKFKAAAK